MVGLVLNYKKWISQGGGYVDGLVFDNIHKNGVPLDQWLADFHAPNGVKASISDF